MTRSVWDWGSCEVVKDDYWCGFQFFLTVSGRVRVAVRLRPRNAEELAADADFADCVELQPEVFRPNH